MELQLVYEQGWLKLPGPELLSLLQKPSTASSGLSSTSISTGST
jgi:hypothetical protein